MPKQPTSGTKQFGVELTAEVLDRWRAFCADRGGVRYCTELAFNRFMGELERAPPSRTEGTVPPPAKTPRKKKDS